MKKKKTKQPLDDEMLNIAKELEEELNKLKEAGELSSEEMTQLERDISKFKARSLYNANHKPRGFKKVIFLVVKFFQSLLIYLTNYVVCFGLFSSGITVKPKYAIILFILFLCIYQIICKRLLSFVIKKTRRYLSIYFAFMIITMILMHYTTLRFNYVSFNSVPVLIGFYLLGEILNMAVRFYYAKYSLMQKLKG